jgi:hypothetical protein
MGHTQGMEDTDDDGSTIESYSEIENCNPSTSPNPNPNPESNPDGNIVKFDVRIKIRSRKEVGDASATKATTNGYGSLIDDVESSSGHIQKIVNTKTEKGTLTNANGRMINGRLVNDKGDLIECFFGASIPLSESCQTWRFWALFSAFLTICGTGKPSFPQPLF